MILQTIAKALTDLFFSPILNVFALVIGAAVYYNRFHDWRK